MFNQAGIELGAQHFWADCSLNLVIESSVNSETSEVHNNAIEVVRVLYATKMQHNLFFNPNMSDEGIRGKAEVHGLVMVLVCGTLHQQDKCVGVFEQLFCLIRDPTADNSWKIKSTKLLLKSRDTVSRLPTLEEGNLKMLMLPSSTDLAK
ncbi:hypothetical protein C0J52_05204 [Blattella germanica]|nr:hypothetical protein C0J52_05204 [Blattella germanica]